MVASTTELGFDSHENELREIDENAVITHHETEQPQVKGKPSKRARGSYQEFLVWVGQDSSFIAILNHKKL